MATSSTGAAYYSVGKSLSDVLENEEGIVIHLVSGADLNTLKNCEMLIQGDVDFAFAQNDTPIDMILANNEDLDPSVIRTVIPVYPEVLFLIYPDSLNPGTLDELIVGKKVGIGPTTSGTARFMKILFASFGIDTTQYQPVYTSFDENLLSNPDIEVSCALTGINNPRMVRLLTKESGKMFSMDDFRLANQGSAVDGFCINYPRSRPFIVPKNTYGQIPQEPILTVAIDGLLLTTTNLDQYEIYEVVKAIFDNVQPLSNQNSLLGLLTENFDVGRLNFPLHQGVRNYLERNEPTFLERYAEVIGVAFSIIVVIFGGATSLGRIMRKARKERIDIYFLKVIEMEEQLDKDPVIEELIKLEKEIEELKRQGYIHVTKEKLTPDESFRIFINQANEALAKVRQRIAEAQR